MVHSAVMQVTSVCVPLGHTIHCCISGVAGGLTSQARATTAVKVLLSSGITPTVLLLLPWGRNIT